MKTKHAAATAFRELVVKTRSFRRFRQEEPVPQSVLEELVDLGRLAASGGNRQSLKFMVSCEPELNARIFPCLAWAGYLTDWPGPAEGERPAAYITILGDTAVAPSAGCDHGIAAQNIMLGATALGLGGCMIGSVKRDALRQVLALAPNHEILLVLALGVPAETVILETVKNGDIKYWRDAAGRHHVPKRPLQEVLLPAP
jgi:nitroreductase